MGFWAKCWVTEWTERYEMLSPSLFFTSLHYMWYICENCSIFLLGGFLGPSELFDYWRPASFIIQGKVSWIRFLFLNVSYILKIAKGTTNPRVEFSLGKTSIEKKRFLSGIARMMGGGGGLPMPEFFGPLSRSAFLVNKKSLFLQKCQCIELLIVF